MGGGGEVGIGCRSLVLSTSGFSRTQGGSGVVDLNLERPARLSGADHNHVECVEHKSLSPEHKKQDTRKILIILSLSLFFSQIHLKRLHWWGGSTIRWLLSQKHHPNSSSARGVQQPGRETLVQYHIFMPLLRRPPLPPYEGGVFQKVQSSIRPTTLCALASQIPFS